MDDFDTIPLEVEPEFQAETEVKPQSWFYGPDGQSGIFEKAPAGWFDHPSKVRGAPDPSLLTSEKRRDRASLMKELRLLGIPFVPNASSKQMEAILIDAQNKARTEKARAAKAAKPKDEPKPRKPKKAAKAAKA